MHITGQSFEIVKWLFGAQVACAQNVLDFARYQELLEARRQWVTSVRDVEVTQQQHQLLKRKVQQ